MNLQQERLIQVCEDGGPGLCRCRCGHGFHGARRGPIVDLDAGDPHSPKIKCLLCNGTGTFETLHLGEPWSTTCPDCDGIGWSWPKRLRSDYPAPII